MTDVPLVSEALQDAVNEAAKACRVGARTLLLQTVNLLLPDDPELRGQVLSALVQSALGQAYVEESVPTMVDMSDHQFNTAVRERSSLLEENFAAHMLELRRG